MKAGSSRFAKMKAAATFLGVVAIVGGCVLVILALAPVWAAHRSWLVPSGLLGVFFGILLIIIAHLLIKVESNTFRLYNQILDLHEVGVRQNDLLRQLVENTALSDAAKTLTNRDRELESLRAAIRGDIRTEDWEAALYLVDGMERRFGYAEEAGNLRHEIQQARVEAMRTKWDEATALIQRLLDGLEWEKAGREIERLQRALPDERRISSLREMLESRKGAHKAALLNQWNEAVQRNDVDEGIRILRELDGYLTREEARSLEASARGVFKARLLQLGMQFQFAVREQRWRDALEIGVQIIDEYPNSRMAQEAEEAMEGLRRRAGMLDVEITAGDNPAGADAT